MHFWEKKSFTKVIPYMEITVPKYYCFAKNFRIASIIVFKLISCYADEYGDLHLQ